MFTVNLFKQIMWNKINAVFYFIGDSDTNYVRNFIKILAKLGYRSVLM